MTTTTATTGAVPATIRRPILGWSVHDGLVVTRRNLIQTIRVPELLFFSLVQPVIFVLHVRLRLRRCDPRAGRLARGRCGGLPAVPRCPASSVRRSRSRPRRPRSAWPRTCTRASSTASARCRWPRPRCCSAAPRPTRCGMILVLAVLTATGFLVGWRINDGAANAALAYALLLLFAYTVAWIGAWVGPVHAQPGDGEHRGAGLAVPADVPLQRVRAAGRDAGVAADDRGVEPAVGAGAVVPASCSATRPGIVAQDVVVVPDAAPAGLHAALLRGAHRASSSRWRCATTVARRRADPTSQARDVPVRAGRQPA